MKRATRLMMALSAAVLAACAASNEQPSAADGGRDVMELELKLARTDLVIGEDTALTLVLHNTSSAALTIPDPELNRSVPQMRLRDLQTKTQKNFGPVAAPANEFTPPLPEPDVDLPSGGERKIESTLMKRAPIDHAGKYELGAYFRWATGEATSKPVSLTVHPLSLQSACFVGAHSGPSPFRDCVWSHADAGGSVLLLTSTTFSPHGDPATTQSVRLTRVDGEVHPVLSTSRNGTPFPGKWAVWLEGTRLCGLYLTHGEARVTAKPADTGLTAAAIVSPALSVPDDKDASRPARGEVALASAGGGANKLAIRMIEADGSIASGPETTIGKGTLAWSRAVALKDGTRRYFFALQRGAEIELRMLDWDGGSSLGLPSSLFEWQGDALASGASLGEGDTTSGATVLAVEGRGYRLQAWKVAADGTGADAAAVALALPKDVKLDRAIVELSPEGNILTLLRADYGRWFVANREGHCTTLPPEFADFGEPIGAFWLNEGTPLVITASPELGIVYHELHIG